MKNSTYNVMIKTPEEITTEKYITVRASEDELIKQIEKLKDRFPESEISITKRFSVIPAITFLSIAWILTLVPYYNGFNSIRLFPNVKSLLFGLAIYSAFIIRIKGIKKTFSTVADSIVSILFILILSSFIKVFFSDL